MRNRITGSAAQFAQVHSQKRSCKNTIDFYHRLVSSQAKTEHTAGFPAHNLEQAQMRFCNFLVR